MFAKYNMSTFSHYFSEHYRGGSGSYALNAVQNPPLKEFVGHSVRPSAITISLIIGVPAGFRGLIALNLCPSLPLRPPSIRPSITASDNQSEAAAEQYPLEPERKKRKRGGAHTKPQMTKPKVWKSIRASSANTTPILIRMEQSSAGTWWRWRAKASMSHRNIISKISASQIAWGCVPMQAVTVWNQVLIKKSKPTFEETTNQSAI